MAQHITSPTAQSLLDTCPTTSDAFAQLDALLEQVRNEPPAPPQAPELPSDYDPFTDTRVAFGCLLRRWLMANGFSQDTVAHLQKATGHGHLSVHNSQMSAACAGNLHAKPKFFAGLANANRLVAERDLHLPELRRQGHTNLANRLANAHAVLRRTDGTPWRASDFFAAYVGE